MSVMAPLIKKQSNKQGFTIVELVVIIVVIGILAGIGVIGYGAWRQSIATKAVKSDLEIVKTSMSSAQNFSETGFPSEIPSSFVSGPNVAVTYVNGSNTQYCIEARSVMIATIVWHVEGKVGSAVVSEGTCPAVNGWKDLASSSVTTCAVSNENKIYCWGAAGSTPTLLGNGDIPTTAVISTITASTGHFCVVADDWGYCWGTNTFGRLGDGTTTNRTTPTAVARGTIAAGKKLADISAGEGHTCALTADFLTYCWGYGAYGALGRNMTTNSYTPIATVQGGIPAGVTAKAIAVGGYNSCMIGSDNWAYCWGYGIDGEVGNGGNAQVNSPTPVARGVMPVAATISAISVGSNHSCAITNANTTFCWGSGYEGRLGNGGTADSSTPVAVSQGSVTFTKFSIGVGDTCAVTPGGVGYCWGSNTDGQVGAGASYASSSYLATPVVVQNGAKPAGIAFSKMRPGSIHTCALASNSKIYCWGNGSNSKLGNGASTSSSIPVAITEVF